MKRIYLILLLGSLCFGCTKVLDKPLLDEISESTYWKTSTDMELYINQFYTAFSHPATYYNLDNNSDNLQPMTPNEVMNGTRSIPSSGSGWTWTDIRKINFFFQNASKVTEGTAGDIDQYKGEGYFLRAYLYFEKLRRFGDVPWYDETLNINSEELYAARDPRNEITDRIISDLDSAIAFLKEKDKLPTGRINRGCALLFKSRVCLYEGTWEKYHQGDPFGVDGSNGEKYLSLAANAAERLIGEGNFSLYSTGNPEKDYYALFSQDDLSGNTETLLFETIDPAIGLSDWNWAYLNGQGAGASGITKQLVDYYLCKDGLPVSLSKEFTGDSTLVQAATNRDPRLEQTIWIPGQVRLNTQPNVTYFLQPTLATAGDFGTSTGYMVKKGSTTDPEQNTGSSSDLHSKLDRIVFRYAEALLNYAEAHAELGTLNQAGLDKSVNLLRARVGMPPLKTDVGYVDPGWDFPALSPLINEIWRERRIELATEGFRYDDLMRWAAGEILIKGRKLKGARFIKGISFPQLESQLKDIAVDAGDYIDRYQKSVPNGFGFNAKRDYLYPIPTNELTLNKNLTQNPGW